MRVYLVIALVALVCGLVDSEEGQNPGQRLREAMRKFKKAVLGRNAMVENGEVEVEGKGKKFRMIVLGIVAKDVDGEVMEATRLEKGKNFDSLVPDTDESLDFSTDESGDGPIEGRCVSAIQDLNDTTVNMKCCIAKGNGTVDLGTVETIDIKPKDIKCSFMISGYEAPDGAAKVCLRVQVKPPRGAAAACGDRPSGNTGRRPKICDLGDDTTMGLSALCLEFTGTDPTAANANPQWHPLTEEDVTLKPHGSKLILEVACPVPASGNNLWFDPIVEMEAEDYEEVDESEDDDNGSAVMTVTMTTVAIATTISMLFN